MTLTLIGQGARAHRRSRVETSYFPFEMGYNIVDPPIELRPGVMLDGENYEVHYRRGYQRVDGYERYDGRGKPSDSLYSILNYTVGGTEPQVDDVVTGATSGATGTILLQVAPETGSFAGNDAAGYMVLWDVTGDFQDGENLEISASKVAEADGAQTLEGASTDALHETYRRAAIEARRTQAQKVPGSGPVRGVWKHRGDYYAFRDNAGGTECKLFKATTSGWAEQELGGTMGFDGGGTVEIFDGDTIEGGTSGATAAARRVVAQSGSWSAGTAAGYLVLYSVVGTFQDGETITNTETVRVPFNSGSVEPSVGDTLTGATSGASGEVKELLPLDSGSWAGNDADGNFVLTNITGTFNGTENINNTTTSASNIATNNGAQDGDAAQADGTYSATTLSPGGRYEFINHNFGGHEDTRHMYGTDGVNNAFEWSGTTYVPIMTGMVDDSPEFLAAHKGHLFLSFSGGSLQHSSTGLPLVWSPLLGASELAVGEEITGLSIEVGDVLAVFGRSETYMLYGENSSNWNLRRFHQGSGGVKYTVQKMGVTWMLDDQGVTALSATEQFGDFLQSTTTSHIQPFIDRNISSTQASVRVRKKNQYRLFFSNKIGLTITIERNNVKGVTKFKYEDQFNCVYSVKDDEESLGDETEDLLAGGDEGYVYFVDSGTSFDGAEVLAWFLPNYHHYGTPSHSKTYRGLTLELSSLGEGEISIIPDFNYGATEVPSALEQAQDILGGGGRWEVDDWDDFLWSAPLVDQARFRLNGVGRNMAFLVISEHTYERTHTIQGAIVEYARRRLIR